MAHILFLKNKKATINPKDKADKCFQYGATVAFSYKEIKCNPGRVSNIKPFINKKKGRNNLSIENRWFQNVWEK